MTSICSQSERCIEGIVNLWKRRKQKRQTDKKTVGALFAINHHFPYLIAKPRYGMKIINRFYWKFPKLEKVVSLL